MVMFGFKGPNYIRDDCFEGFEGCKGFEGYYYRGLLKSTSYEGH